jgi:preprotein translocase subunit YajC
MALAGEIVTTTGGMMVTVADADTARSAAEVAVTTI